jgi:hypothetical protein
MLCHAVSCRALQDPWQAGCVSQGSAAAAVATGPAGTEWLALAYSEPRTAGFLLRPPAL